MANLDTSRRRANLVKNVVAVISKIIGFIIIIIIVIFAFKGCIVTAWSQPSENSTYAIYGDDGRIMKLIFLEKTKAIFYYKESYEFEEAVQVDLRGEYGTNYIGGLWHLEGPNTILRFRIYPKGVRPVSAEMTVEKRYINCDEESSFAKTGKTTYPVFLIRDDAINFSDMWLKKEESNIDFIKDILSKLE